MLARAAAIVHDRLDGDADEDVGGSAAEGDDEDDDGDEDLNLPSESTTAAPWWSANDEDGGHEFSEDEVTEFLARAAAIINDRLDGDGDEGFEDSEAEVDDEGDDDDDCINFRPSPPPPRLGGLPMLKMTDSSSHKAWSLHRWL